MFYIYILYSESLDSFYVGSTSNVETRLEKHLQNHKGYTARAKDWKIVYTEIFQNKLDALSREKQIKNWKSKKMIEKLISF